MSYQDMDSTENPFLNTLRLPVKIPFSVIFLVLAVHVISLFLPWVTRLDLGIKLFASGFVALSMGYYLYDYFLSSDEKKVSELILSAEDKWTIRTEDGQVYTATLGTTQFVHPWLTIVSLKYGKGCGYYIFTPEVIDKDQFRRLRVRLRYKLDYEV